MQRLARGRASRAREHHVRGADAQQARQRHGADAGADGRGRVARQGRRGPRRGRQVEGHKVCQGIDDQEEGGRGGGDGWGWRGGV